MDNGRVYDFIKPMIETGPFGSRTEKLKEKMKQFIVTKQNNMKVEDIVGLKEAKKVLATSTSANTSNNTQLSKPNQSSKGYAFGERNSYFWCKSNL